MSETPQSEPKSVLRRYRKSLVSFWALYSAALTVSMMVPGDSVPDLGFFGWDKLAHLVVFIVLAFLTAGAFLTRDCVITIVMSWGVLLGCATEFAQALAPGRIPSVGDAAANLIGTVFGALLVKRYLLRD